MLFGSASILHAPDERSFFPLFCFDVGKAKRESAFSELHLRPRQLLLRPPVEEALALLDQMTTARRPVAFDIETERGAPTWNCIAVADGPERALCVPTRVAWGADAEYVLRVREAVTRLLEDPQVPKIAQNAQFDILFLRHYYGIQTRGLMFDTMTAHHTAYPELPKSLELLTSIYTDQPHYKDMEKIPPSLWEYNALDAAVTYECYQALEDELREIHNRDFYQTYVLELIDPLLDMQEQGVCVDQSKRGEVAQALQEEVHDTQADLTHKALGWVAIQQTPDGISSGNYVGLNASSPLQLQEYLFKTLKMPPSVKRQTGNLTTDEDSLERLSKRYDHPSIPLILTIRGVRKLLSTYVLAPLGEDGRLRCSYVVGGTDTGRLASRESILGSGTNLQNVPHGIARRLLIPSGGLVFVEADLSQAEARIVAYLTGDERLIDLFTRGGFDIHRENAGYLFHYGDSREVTAAERTIAKKLVHAANYGMGPVGFQEALRKDAKMDLTRADAGRLLALYHARFPKIKQWHREVERTLGKTRQLRTPLGWTRRFFGRWNDELLRNAYAFVPQSTVACILNRGLIDLYRQVCTLKARLVLTVHDSVVLEAPPEAIHQLVKLLKSCLERPITINGRTCVIPCDIKTGPNWEDMSPYEP